MTPEKEGDLPALRVSPAEHHRHHNCTCPPHLGTVTRGEESITNLPDLLVHGAGCWSRLHPSSQHHPDTTLLHREPLLPLSRAEGVQWRGQRTGVCKAVCSYVKHWEETASNPAQTWAPPNQTTEDPRGPKHSVCIRGKVLRAVEGMVCSWSRRGGQLCPLPMTGIKLPTAPTPCCVLRQSTLCGSGQYPVSAALSQGSAWPRKP